VRHTVRILGGFAGHGFNQGVNVSRVTFERVCNDCGFAWSSDADERTRIDSPCAARPIDETDLTDTSALAGASA
jgi:hypothetical protein